MSAQEKFLEQVGATFVKNLQTITKKNRDYALEDNPFDQFERAAQFLDKPVEDAYMFEITKKLIRIKNLLTKEPDVVGESLVDSLNDAMNYLAHFKVYIETGGVFEEVHEPGGAQQEPGGLEGSVDVIWPDTMQAKYKDVQKVGGFIEVETTDTTPKRDWLKRIGLKA